MKCFNHPQQDAVAVCSSCHKGLCSACVSISMAQKVVCSEACANELKEPLKDRAKASKLFNLVALFSLGAAVYFIGFGIFDIFNDNHKDIGISEIIVGVACLLLSIALHKIYKSKKHPAQNQIIQSSQTPPELPPAWPEQAEGEGANKQIVKLSDIAKIILANIIIGLGVFALFSYLIHRYLQDEHEQFNRMTSEVKIIAAATNLAAGTVLRYEDIGASTIFYKNGHYSKHYILKDDYPIIIGHKLRSGVEKFEPILWADVDLPGNVRSAPQLLTNSQWTLGTSTNQSSDK